MFNIVNSALLAAGYFCIFINIPELCFEMQLGYFGALLSQCVRCVWGSAQCRTNHYSTLLR